MFKRLLSIPEKGKKSFFLFGPRGTGKTSWVKTAFPDAIYLDLLQSALYFDLSARPERLEQFIPPQFNDWVIVDEIQRVPILLNEVHRLIEEKGIKFVLTGSSARSLRKKGVNLLAGRAVTYHLHPLTIQEIGDSFYLEKALQYGLLPAVFSEDQPEKYLESYVTTYLQEEVLEEGLTRNIGAFTRFVEAASFSNGQILNMSNVAREASVSRKVVEGYFDILEDLLLAYRLPVFTRRAHRKMVAHPKFYFFDVGIYRTIRPKGPLDLTDEIIGVGMETLFLQNILALNDYYHLGYSFFYWRTVEGQEVDFILYGKNGLFAFEVTKTRSIGLKDLRSLQSFARDYPEAKLFLICNVQRREYHGNIQVIPYELALKSLLEILQVD